MRELNWSSLFAAVVLQRMSELHGIWLSLVFGFLGLNDKIAVRHVWTENSKGKQFLLLDKIKLLFTSSDKVNIYKGLHDRPETGIVIDEYTEVDMEKVSINIEVVNFEPESIQSPAIQENVSVNEQHVKNIMLVHQGKIHEYLSQLPREYYAMYISLCGQPV